MWRTRHKGRERGNGDGNRDEGGDGREDEEDHEGGDGGEKGSGNWDKNLEEGEGKRAWELTKW